MIGKVKQKITQVWAQLTPEQKIWIPRVMLATGISLILKSIRFIWPSIGMAVITTIVYIITISFIVRLILYTPRVAVIRPWLVPLFAGGFLNQAVVLANNGHMPSTFYQIPSGFYIPMEGARLSFLGDWIFSFMSLGDIIMLISLIGVLVALALRPKWYTFAYHLEQMQQTINEVTKAREQYIKSINEDKHTN